jgi:hypothetical protein
MKSSIRAAASAIALLDTLADTSTANTIDSCVVESEITGRANASARTTTSSDRTAVCRTRWRGLKFVRA